MSQTSWRSETDSPEMSLMLRGSVTPRRCQVLEGSHVPPNEAQMSQRSSQLPQGSDVSQVSSVPPTLQVSSTPQRVSRTLQVIPSSSTSLQVQVGPQETSVSRRTSWVSCASVTLKRSQEPPPYQAPTPMSQQAPPQVSRMPLQMAPQGPQVPPAWHHEQMPATPTGMTPEGSPIAQSVLDALALLQEQAPWALRAMPPTSVTQSNSDEAAGTIQVEASQDVATTESTTNRAPGATGAIQTA